MTAKTSQITPRLYGSMQLAFELFGHDARKSTNVPVMSHLLSVCALVQNDGGDEDEAIAALLHDTLEDRPDKITRAEILERFGHRVLEIVEVSTDTPLDYRGGPKPPWKGRKQFYLDRVCRTNPALLRVTVADKIDNIRSILANYEWVGNEVWERFNASEVDIKWYYEEAVRAYEEAGYQGPLLDELRRLVDLFLALPE